MRITRPLFIGGALLPLLASPLLAHTGKGHAAGFLTGLQHPWSGLDHVAAMVAVGIWGAQLGSPAIWVLPVAFPMLMAVGGVLGLLGVPLPGIEIGIALSALFLGVMVLGERKPRLAIAVAVVGVFALFHGHAHGTELPAGQSALLYSMGFVIGTGTLHGVGISLGLAHRWPAGRVVLRVVGACIAIAGLVFLWQAIS